MESPQTDPTLGRAVTSPRNDRFLRLQRDQHLTLWYIGKRKQGFLRNHAIPQFTFLTPVGNRCITPCVCVKEPSRSRGVIPTAGDLSVHKGTVFCRNIRRHIQRYWILRRLCRSISCSVLTKLYPWLAATHSFCDNRARRTTYAYHAQRTATSGTCLAWPSPAADRPRDTRGVCVAPGRHI